MATQPRNTLKNWFRTELKPTQSQFWAWLDSFWHQDDDIPSSKIDGLQTLLDTKMDKKDVVAPEQVGPYKPLKNYIFDALLAEYVSFSNPDSENSQFKVEGFYRLLEDAPAGQDPETHTEKWAYQGNSLGDIVIEDVIGLREELDWLKDNAGGGDALTRAYSIDFGLNSIAAQEINMFGAVHISNINVSNVGTLKLTWSGGLQVAIIPGEVNLPVVANDILTWEITRISPDEIASVGVHLIIEP